MTIDNSRQNMFSGLKSSKAQQPPRTAANAMITIIAIQLGLYDTTTIRLYDVSRPPTSIRRDSTRAKDEHVNFSSYSRIVVAIVILV